MVLETITKKGNYMLENSEKCLKNPEKSWKNSHGSWKCQKMQINPTNIQINCFSGWKNQEKIRNNFQKIKNIDKYFMKIISIFFVHWIAYNFDINVFFAQKNS